MKKILSLLLFVSLITITNSFGQIRKIPAEVTESFKSIYPSAQNVEWKDKIASFSAVFELEGKKHEARFKEDGTWHSTETNIEVGEIPSEVKDGLSKSKYSEWEIEKAVKIELPESKVNYKLQVFKSDINKKNLLFDKSGKMLKDNRTL